MLIIQTARAYKYYGEIDFVLFWRISMARLESWRRSISNSWRVSEERVEEVGDYYRWTSLLPKLKGVRINQNVCIMLYITISWYIFIKIYLREWILVASIEAAYMSVVWHRGSEGPTSIMCSRQMCAEERSVPESIFVTCTVYESIDGPQGGAARLCTGEHLLSSALWTCEVRRLTYIHI